MQLIFSILYSPYFKIPCILKESFFGLEIDQIDATLAV